MVLLGVRLIICIEWNYCMGVYDDAIPKLDVVLKDDVYNYEGIIVDRFTNKVINKMMRVLSTSNITGIEHISAIVREYVVMLSL